MEEPSDPRAKSQYSWAARRDDDQTSEWSVTLKPKFKHNPYTLNSQPSTLVGFRAPEGVWDVNRVCRVSRLCSVPKPKH